MTELLLLLLLWLYLMLQLLVWSGFLSIRRSRNTVAATPKVAILIPARNEAANIERCLQSVVQLNYPAEHLEVWVGNDASEDQTASIVAAYEKKYSHIHLKNIEGNLGQARAKSNVLAQLMHCSTAPFVFVTDADIAVHPQWIQSLLPQLMQHNTGMVSGTTLVQGKSWLEQQQGIDWIMGNGYITALSQLGIPGTAVGNNMAFTRQAYLETGGYENMPFSVTEDFQLYTAIRRQGFHTLNKLEPYSVNISAAQKKLIPLLQQRKRWMLGARALPWYWLLIFFIQAAFYPALVFMAFIHLKQAIWIWAVKILLQQTFALAVMHKLRQKLPLRQLITFEMYTLCMQWLMILYFIWPVAMKWKEREYT